MQVTLFTNASETSGVGKPVVGLTGALRARGHEIITQHLDAGRRATFLNGRALKTYAYPLGMVKPLFWLWAGLTMPIPSQGILHFTNQTLSFVARRAPTRSVITVWDLIELHEPQMWGSRPSARLLYRGIADAAQIITPSQLTADDVCATYGVPHARVHVVPPGLPPRIRYQPELRSSEAVRELLRRHSIPENRLIVLYVGSEHPRKNLVRLAAALARVRRVVPNLFFVKVGSAGSDAGRAAFKEALRQYGLEEYTRLVEESGDDSLALWYHRADVLAFPSLYEGFGFPPLEALACGCPVVTSQRSTLPEVVGDAARLVDPLDVSAIADGIEQVATDERVREELKRRGLSRASQFTWERAAEAVERVYGLVNTR